MTLAILGGAPVRSKIFAGYNTIGEEEKQAVLGVLDSGKLSKFIGGWNQYFYGGDQIQAFEKEWAEYFNVKHAITVNSCTSGLYAAVGAIGIEPGDEIIVSPYTMAASATAAVVFGAIPVFADIEEDHFCLCPKSVESKITSKTKAIIVVDIFGNPYNATEINRIAKKHNLKVIEDTAQAPGAKYNGQFAGTLADVGVFSLNYHKHIHTGEGGVVVTNDDVIADRIRLIRNHAEAVVEAKNERNIVNMIGQNYRMTEIEAAIGRCQLKKLNNLLEKRKKNVKYLVNELTKIPAITHSGPRENSEHSYYVLPFKFHSSLAEGIHRNNFIKAVRAELAPTQYREGEGPLLTMGYVKPLYLLPMFQQKIAFGSKGFPFSLNPSISYEKGLCPVVEKMHFEEIFLTSLMEGQLSQEDLDDVVKAFYKVWENRKQLIGKEF